MNPRQSAPTRLYLSNRPDHDAMSALVFGTPDDGQPSENWEGVNDDFGFLRDGEDGPIIGFLVNEVSKFDPDLPEHARLWEEPLFDVPVLALRDAPAGAIIRAAQVHFDGSDSLNRRYFNLAMQHTGEDALDLWTACLEAGDSMAHFAIGYTQFELGRFELAYRHLRYYAEIAPDHPWNLCWFGKAAEAVGEPIEARRAYERAIELEEAGHDATDAPELLAALNARTGSGSSGESEEAA